MKKKIMTALLCVSLVLAGCNGESENGQPNSDDGAGKKTEESAEEKEKEAKLDMITSAAYRNVDGLDLEPGSFISIIGRQEDGNYWKELQAGVTQAAEDLNEELGYTGEDKIKITFDAPSKKDDVSDQVNILDEELARYPGAVAISVIDAAACQVQFDLALENGIPIVSYDAGTDYKGIAATCTTDSRAAGAEEAVRLAKSIGGSGEVALIVHDATSLNASEREQGFQEEMRSHYPDITISCVYHLDELSNMKPSVANYYNNDTDPNNDVDPNAVDQKMVMKYILATNKNLKGCAATSEEATKVIVEELKVEKNKTMKVVGFDGGKTNRTYLENGDIEGFVLQNPYGMGYATVVASARATLDLGNEAVVNTGYTWVDQDNYDQKSIQNLLY